MTMPGKLKVAIGLLMLSIGMNFISGKWVAGSLGIALLIGVIKGSEGSRVIVMGLSALGFVLSVLTMVGGLAFPPLMIAGLLGAVQTGFLVFCMRDPQVQDWMFKRSMPASVRNL